MDPPGALSFDRVRVLIFSRLCAAFSGPQRSLYHTRAPDQPQRASTGLTGPQNPPPWAWMGPGRLCLALDAAPPPLVNE
ncbi:protein of unknown function [Streptantibioticus cattleyicolor NRRL 8057 = DSM 46488]|nr:protein of unknown function [Streptantibioticus cattleyicolor NRRL 8057 = DSM 46488]